MAIRAGISVAVPLLILWAVGRIDLSMYAAFGAFTSLYGRNHLHLSRMRMQGTVGALLTASITAGVLIGTLESRAWWSIPVAAVLACLGAVLSDLDDWHPPGPLFLIFAFGACSSVPSTLAQVPVAALVGFSSAAFALVVGTVGWVRRPLPRPPRAGRRLGELWADGTIRLHLIRYASAVVLAGGLATAVGIGHPYWAMVGAVVPMAGRDLAAQVTRGTQRLIGTLLGLGVSALLLALDLRGLVLIILIVGLQALAELLVGRNYGLALMFITPLALLMGQLVAPQPAGTLLFDRGVETLIGVLIGITLTVATRDRGLRRRKRTTN